MSLAESGRRGAGANRSGATDTTMLIWKVIDANPGITRDEIFAKIEHEIPAGWAKRRYAVEMKRGSENANSLHLNQARSYIVAHTLRQLRRRGTVERNHIGGYRILRSIKIYKGNPDHVDETGTLAAEQINAAYAERTLRAAAKRLNPTYPHLSQREYRAFMLIYGASPSQPA